MKTIQQLLAISAICIGLPAANGAGLLNGDFESPNVGPIGAYYTSTPAGFGWTLASGDLDLVGPSRWQQINGNQSLDLNGFGPGRIYQDFTFASAGTWTIKFDLSANFNPPAQTSLKVSFGLAGGTLTDLGTYNVDSSLNSAANMNWQTITTPSVTAQDLVLYRLQFTSLNSGSSGPVLDDVRLITVPEPAVAAMVGLGIVTGLLVRQKKHA